MRNPLDLPDDHPMIPLVLIAIVVTVFTVAAFAIIAGWKLMEAIL